MGEIFCFLGCARVGDAFKCQKMPKDAKRCQKRRKEAKRYRNRLNRVKYDKTSHLNIKRCQKMPEQGKGCYNTHLVGHYVPRCAKMLRFNVLRFALRACLPCLFRPLVALFRWLRCFLLAISYGFGDKRQKKRHKKRSKRHKNRETLRTREKSANSKKRTCQKCGAMVCGVFSLIGVLGGDGVGVVSPLAIEAIDSNQPRRDNQKTPLSSSTKGKHTKIVLFLSSCRHLKRFRLTFAILPVSLWGNWEGW